MKTIQIAQFLGMDNKLPDTEMRVATSQLNGQYLRSGINVEVDNAGRLRRRNATARVQALTAPHSIFMTSLTTGYQVQLSALYAITLPTFTSNLIKSLTSNDPMSWKEIGADLYYSNGIDSGRITAGVVYPLGLPTPDVPAAAAIAGSLLAGAYKVAVSYRNMTTGEEGGISPWQSITIADAAGIRVTLPAATLGASHINIYLTAANGSVLMWAAVVATGTTTYDATTLAAGRTHNGRFEHPLPAGRLFTSNGRLCSIVGSRVYLGSAWKYGYCELVRADGSGGYINFPAPVSIAIECQGGTYIAAKKTHWFPGGDLTNVQAMIADVFPYGAVPGTEFEFPDESKVGWFGESGVVFGSTSGEVTAVMEEHIDQTPPASGSSIVFEDKGYTRVVSCGWCVNLANKAATKYEDWDFTSVSGRYGTKADGVYDLIATGAVDWSFDLGKMNFDTEAMKYMPTVYVGVACVTELEMTIRYADARCVEQEYTYTTRGACEFLKQQRFDVGRGARANWFALSFGNFAGDDFTLASMSFAPAATTRRI